MKNSDPIKVKVQALFKEGLDLQALHRFDEAEQKYLAALALYPGLPDVLRSLSDIYKARGDFDKADTILQDALALYGAGGDDTGKARIYAAIGALKLTRGDLDAAEAFTEKALDLQEDAGDRKGLAYAYGNIATIYTERHDFAGAERMYRRSLDIHRSLGDSNGIATAAYNFGILYFRHDDYDQAEPLYLESLALREKLGQKEDIADSCNVLAALHFARWQFDEAEKLFRRALALFNQLGAREKLESVQRNLELLAKARAQEPSDAARRKEERDALQAKVSALLDEGATLHEHGDLDAAEKNYLAALDLWPDLPDILSNLGNLYLARGDLAKAEAAYRKAMARYTQLGGHERAEKMKRNLQALGKDIE